MIAGTVSREELETCRLHCVALADEYDKLYAAHSLRIRTLGGGSIPWKLRKRPTFDRCCVSDGKDGKRALRLHLEQYFSSACNVALLSVHLKALPEEYVAHDRIDILDSIERAFDARNMVTLLDGSAVPVARLPAESPRRQQYGLLVELVQAGLAKVRATHAYCRAIMRVSLDAWLSQDMWRTVARISAKDPKQVRTDLTPHVKCMVIAACCGPGKDSALHCLTLDAYEVIIKALVNEGGDSHAGCRLSG